MPLVKGSLGYSSEKESYRTLNEARTDVFDYIERFHNPRMRRRVATLGSEVISYFKTVRGNGVEPPPYVHDKDGEAHDAITEHQDMNRG